MHVLKDFGLCSISDGAISIAHAVIVFDSALNPFAYALINKRFREKKISMLIDSKPLQQTPVSSGTRSREELATDQTNLNNASFKVD